MSFSKYPEYKDSGIELIGEVPANWSTKPLKRVASCNDEVLSENTHEDALIDYVEISDVDSVSGITGSSVYSFRDAPSRARRLVRDQDVLVSTVRTYLRAIAPVRTPAQNLVVSTGFAVIRPDPEKINGGYLGYLTRSDEMISEVISRSVGVSYPAINASEIMQLIVPVPTFDEQSQIAHFLDHETAKIDALLREQERLIKLLQEKRQAVISHAVTKGLDPDVPMKDSGVEWLGEVPVHWEVMPVKFLLSLVTSGSRGWAEFYSDEGELFFRIANLTRDSIRPKLKSTQHVMLPKDSEGSRARIQIGDILVSITADLGSVCAADRSIEGGYVSQHVALARPQVERCYSEWLAFFILGDAAKEQLLGSGYGGTKVQLSLEDIRELVVVVPPMDEQIAIASMLHHRLASMEMLITEANKTVALLSERRSALISAAVTGKIDVCDWRPPADESAVDEEVRKAGLETTA